MWRRWNSEDQVALRGLVRAEVANAVEGREQGL